MSLFRDAISDHLTPAPVDRAARASHPGMAHFAGTGPDNATCRQCNHWGAPRNNFNYSAKGGGKGGAIKPHPCAKHRALSQKIGPAVPDDAQACRHFVDAPSAPEKFQRG